MSRDNRFGATVWGPDPGRPGKKLAIREAPGVLRIDTATGEVQVLEPMPGDDKGQTASRAASKLWHHWQAGEYPRKTMRAAG